MAKEEFSYLKYINPAPASRHFLTDEEIGEFAPEVDLEPGKAGEGGVPVYTRDGKKAAILGSDRHALVIGATGSMKTRAVLIPTLYSLACHGENMIVSDPKGEIFEKTSGFLKKNGYEVHCLNFRDGKKSSTWNPLDLPYAFLREGNVDRSIELVTGFASILCNKLKSERDPYWHSAAKQLIQGLSFLLMSLAEKPEQVTVNNVMACLAEISAEEGGYTENFSKLVNSLPGTSFISRYLTGTINNAKNPARCITSLATTALGPFDGASIKRLTAKTSFCYQDFADPRKKVAFFIVVPDETDTFNGITATFVKEIYEYLIDQASKRPTLTLPRRLNFLLDEFANLPKIDGITSMISAARSRNIRFYLVVQNNAQLEATYGRALAQTIKYNCQNWIFLASREAELLSEVRSVIGGDPEPLASIADLSSLSIRFPRVESIVLNDRSNPYFARLLDMSRYPGLWKETGPNPNNPIPYPAAYPSTRQGAVHDFDLAKFVAEEVDDDAEDVLVEYLTLKEQGVSKESYKAFKKSRHGQELLKRKKEFNDFNII